MAFKQRSQGSSFKLMGSSPVKQDKSLKPKEEYEQLTNITKVPLGEKAFPGINDLHGEKSRGLFQGLWDKYGPNINPSTKTVNPNNPYSDGDWIDENVDPGFGKTKYTKSTYKPKKSKLEKGKDYSRSRNLKSPPVKQKSTITKFPLDSRRLMKKGVTEGAAEATTQFAQNLIKGKKMGHTKTFKKLKHVGFGKKKGKLMKSLKQGFAEVASEKLTRLGQKRINEK